VKPLFWRSLDRVALRLAWPGPTPFDRLRDDVFALLTTTLVVGVVVRDFWRESTLSLARTEARARGR
jgi:hypothetical protein